VLKVAMKCGVLLLSLLFTSFIDIEAFTSRTQKQSKRTHFASGAAANSASNTSIFANKCSDSDTLSSQSEGNNNMTAADTMLFGRFKILANQIFHKTEHSFALVNLRPLVPGHVLVVSNRIAPLMDDLHDHEYDDLWKTVRKVQRVLKTKYNCDAFNVAVQDGESAGQSVPHVHIHILPRYRGDLERNDDIYDQLEMWAPREEDSQKKKRLEVPDDSERKDRTMEEMAEEASIYKALMNQ
jgi:bis(5'-adenosyl)-triphosphatase